MNIRIGIDVDNVLRDTLTEIIKVYNSTFDQDIRREDIKRYDLRHLFREVAPGFENRIFTDPLLKRIIRDAKPVDGAIEAFHKLSSIGEVVIISSQVSYKSMSYTLEWLEEYDLHTSDVCFVKDKSRIEDLTYLVDDCPSNFLGCNYIHGILVDQPYNIRYNNRRVLRFNSILDFANSIYVKTNL